MKYEGEGYIPACQPLNIIVLYTEGKSSIVLGTKQAFTGSATITIITVIAVVSRGPDRDYIILDGFRKHSEKVLQMANI